MSRPSISIVVLLAIPSSIATRLKHGEDRIAESYPATTIVFADIVGFTPWAQRTDPTRVIALLDDLFSRFDAVAAEHGVEKIKTARTPTTRPAASCAGSGWRRRRMVSPAMAP